jgi:hypothetical protein
VFEDDIHRLRQTLRDVLGFRHPAVSATLYGLIVLLIFNFEAWYHAAVHDFFSAHHDLAMLFGSVCIAGLIAILLYVYWLSRGAQLDEFKDFYNIKSSVARRRFKCKIINQDADIEAAIGLTDAIFRTHTPGENRVLRIFERNKRKSVLIVEQRHPSGNRKSSGHHDKEDRAVPVGFASAWPLRSDIGQLFALGKMAEIDLLPDHVLPAAQNRTAEYIYVTGIAVAGAYVPNDASTRTANTTGDTGVRSTILVVSFLDLLMSEFCVDSEYKKIVMIADSPSGLNYMNKFAKFVRDRSPQRVTQKKVIHHGQPTSLMVIEVNHESVRDLRDAILRRLAGVQSRLDQYEHSGDFWHRASV